MDMLPRLFRAPPKPPLLLPELFTTPPKLLAPWDAAGAEALGTLPRLCDGLRSPPCPPPTSDGRGGRESAGTGPSITTMSTPHRSADHRAMSCVLTLTSRCVGGLIHIDASADGDFAARLGLALVLQRDQVIKACVARSGAIAPNRGQQSDDPSLRCLLKAAQPAENKIIP